MSDRNGWSPMGTAPKDINVDLWHKRGYRAADCRWSEARKRHCGVVETGWTERDGSTNPENDYLAWRPTPEPPIEEAKTRTTVTIPSREYRMGDPKTLQLWELLHGLIARARVDLGDEMAFSVVLSRVSYELRHVVGPDEAANILRQFADQQHEITAFDL